VVFTLIDLVTTEQKEISWWWWWWWWWCLRIETCSSVLTSNIVHLVV